VSLPVGRTENQLPIPAFTIKATHSKDSRHTPTVYLLGGVHGDEIEGIYVLEQFFSWIKQESLPLWFNLVVIPCLNLDGNQLKQRVNHRGVDLNRNLPTKDWTSHCTEKKYFPGPRPLSESENQFLLSLFQQYPPTMALSFHSWIPMLNYNGDCLETAVFLNEHNHYPLAGDVGYPTPGSLGTYLPEFYQAPVLTLEFPLLSSGTTLEDIWLSNKKGLQELFFSSAFKNNLERIIQTHLKRSHSSIQ
jgi:protein MpaA